MATKTFKIGLSNTDKQNMAQDVYERLLALTFPEYDTTEDYSVGDFVVYNDQLYKCISATSGAWDSTKWQLATLNDLLTDIESAVAFVNDKANVDGNYPTMTVGVADQLSPYDDESGDDQDEPFSFQATGTGNGTQPDFSTGAIALLKEKQGNTVVVNQLCDIIYIETGEKNGITLTKNNDGSVTLNGTATNLATFIISSHIPTIIKDHYYLFLGGDGSTYGLNSYDATIWGATGIFANEVVKALASGVVSNWRIAVINGTILNNVKVIPLFIDLTQWFNGDIPQDLLDNPDHFFRYYQGSLAYNTGTLVNANGRYIKCIGMNQWDEEWEVGGLASDGTLDDNGARRTTSFIRVTPNTTYYQKCPASAGSGRFAYYDANKNLILFSDFGIHSNDTFVTPSNACFLKITFGVSYGTTYNHDISINLYYEDEARCLTYEPYEVLTNNDTGTEVLGSIDADLVDAKKPSGEINRKTIDIDLGSLTWVKGSSAFYVSGFASANGVKQLSSSEILKILASVNVVPKSESSVSGNKSTYEIYISSGGALNYYAPYDTYADGNALKTALNGKHARFERAEPTTEQGTPYSENLVIDDFGSMDFQGTNGVPQGNLIFYPVDYKAFIDTLYNYTTGTPSNIALKSDLSADKTELQGVDTQLQNAIGGTLRQLLASSQNVDFLNTDFVDLGTLNWSYAGGRFYTSDLRNIVKEANNKGLCTLYARTSENVSNMPNLTFKFDGSKDLNINNTSYTDATTFKNAMKGVLLAYEKASS